MQAARNALKLTTSVGRLPIFQISARGVAMEGVKGFAENEKTIEDLYFTQEDKRLLAKVLDKVKLQSAKTDKASAEAVRVAEMTALNKIVGKYKLTAGEHEALMKWKHTTY